MTCAESYLARDYLPLYPLLCTCSHWNSLWRCKVIDTRPETVLTLYVYMLRCGAPAEKALGYAQELLEQRRAIDHSERCSMSKAIEQYLRERGEYVKPADVPEDEAKVWDTHTHTHTDTRTFLVATLRTI